MTTRPTLLAHLSAKLSYQPETIATEALGHILYGSAAARNALRAALQSGGADIGQIASVRTEAAGEKGERPDGACFDEGGTERVLTEAKFWVGLTGNQPVAYLKRQPDDEGSALLMVARSQGLESLWSELTQRVAQADDVQMCDEHGESEVRRATAETNRRLILIPWRGWLDTLAARTAAAGDLHTVNDVRQL